MQRQQLNLLSHTNSLACCHQLTSRNINSLSNSRLARQRISYRPTVLAANSDRNPHSSRINDVALLSHQNGVYTVGGSIQTPVSTSHVYDMLIDYPNLNRVFSSIDECHTLSEQSALQLLQICRWEFLAFSGTFKTLLNVHEERDAGRVVFSLIKSSFMKDFEGQWQVTSNANWLHALHIMPLLTE
ncbi:TPA: hypothetical protein ACH3X3_007042 [Trebouxia sp. C0006]